MQNIKIFIIIIVFVDFRVIFLLDFILIFYCLIMAAAYPTLCCYSLNGFDGCIPGYVTLATHLYLSVALCGFQYIFRILEKTAFCFYLARTTVSYPYTWTIDFYE